MMNVQEIIAIVFMSLGLIFLVISAIGMLRLPDFYTRMHASGNSETLGLMLCLLGLAIYQGFDQITIKLLMIFILVFIGNPIGTHILSKAALKSGHHIWTKEDGDREGGEE